VARIACKSSPAAFASSGSEKNVPAGLDEVLNREAVVQAWFQGQAHPAILPVSVNAV
jgi:hypothetical protein